MAFVLLIAIVSYHVAAKISQIKCGKELIACVNKTYRYLWESGAERIGRSRRNSVTDYDSSDDNTVTYTEVELTESLLATD